MGLFSRWRGRRNAGHDAGGFDRLNQGWAPVTGTGEEINQISRDVVRARCRDLERNSDNVGAVVDAMERGVVGTGIQLQAKVLKSNGDDDEDLNDRIEELWRVWCKPRNCDVAGRLSFTEMQEMATRRRLVDGGLLFILCTDPGARIPLRLQVKEVDELDTSIPEYKDRNSVHKVVQGIEVNAAGRIAAYHFKEYDRYGWTGKSRRVRARHVIYIEHRTRPSEVREFSPLAKILTRMRDLTQYVQAVSVKERILACLSAFIKRAGGGYLGNPRVTGQRDEATGYQNMKLSPGMIKTLNAGDDVVVVNPSGQASNAREFITMLLRSIGSALGLSYEATSRDMSQVNYSSARQGLIDDHKTYNRWQKYLTEHFLEPVYEAFLTHCVMAGLLDIPDFFTNKERYTRCVFIPNGMPWIDPLKETRANQIALDTCQTTLEEICAGKGMDYREVIRQRAKEHDLMRQYGVEINDKTEGVTADANLANANNPAKH